MSPLTFSPTLLMVWAVATLAVVLGLWRGGASWVRVQSRWTSCS